MQPKPRFETDLYRFLPIALHILFACLNQVKIASNPLDFLWSLAVAAVLRFAHGYEVSEYEDLKKADLPNVLDRFVASVAPGDSVVVYYAGHGAQVGHHNYLVPVDYDGNSAAELVRQSFDVELLHNKLAARARQRILILDPAATIRFRMKTQDWQPWKHNPAPLSCLLPIAALRQMKILKASTVCLPSFCCAT